MTLALNSNPKILAPRTARAESRPSDGASSCSSPDSARTPPAFHNPSAPATPPSPARR
eukprot:CAMPEP_0174896934 /NCGR_PEP_ID=MMETSP0167-20121228/11006_1 /TAXON_ID=38298 /ORGANISM="Rhodella maculata, Strain CCMP736" /LENGTH=57 /DNA_ID=CAMNT_0016136627 /DNA_START=525 /DNA_END=702 /DNA_ORIENTATION=+